MWQGHSTGAPIVPHGLPAGGGSDLEVDRGSVERQVVEGHGVSGALDERSDRGIDESSGGCRCLERHADRLVEEFGQLDEAAPRRGVDPN